MHVFWGLQDMSLILFILMFLFMGKIQNSTKKVNHIITQYKQGMF